MSAELSNILVETIPAMGSDVLGIQKVALAFDPSTPASMRDLVQVLDGYSAVLGRSELMR